MDLLDTVLRASNAERYSDNFKKYHVDSSLLLLLSDEDLQKLDVDDPTIRQSILKNVKNLQIPSE